MAGLAVGGDARPFDAARPAATSAIFPSICFTFAIMLDWGLAARGRGAGAGGSGLLAGGCGTRSGARCSTSASTRWRFGAGAMLVLARARRQTARATRTCPRWRIVAAALTWFIVEVPDHGLAIWLRYGGRWWPIVLGALAFEALTTGVAAAARARSCRAVPGRPEFVLR